MAGRRLGLPSILLLLLFGILAGPVMGLVRPAEMLGNLLYPVVSLAVALILFEGGLSLSVKEFRAVGGVVARLVTLGMLVTWGLTLLAAHWLLGMDWPMSVLLAACRTLDRRLRNGRAGPVFAGFLGNSPGYSPAKPSKTDLGGAISR